MSFVKRLVTSTWYSADIQMPLGIARSPSLGILPRWPVWIGWIDGVPKILAGGVPVIPFNTALRQRARHDGATRKSLAAYARAGPYIPPIVLINASGCWTSPTTNSRRLWMAYSA